MPTWTKVADADVGSSFTLTVPTLTRYGKGTAWVEKVLPAGTHSCQLSTYGTDPAYGVYKECQVSSDAPPDPVQGTTISITGPTDGLVVEVNGVQKYP